MIEELLEKLGEGVALQRSSYAPPHDRWRINLVGSNNTIKETGAATALECLQKYVAYVERTRNEWLNSKPDGGEKILQ